MFETVALIYEKMFKMLAQFRCTAINLIFYKHISYTFRIKHHSTHLLYKDYVDCYVTKTFQNSFLHLVNNSIQIVSET